MFSGGVQINDFTEIRLILEVKFHGSLQSGAKQT